MYANFRATLADDTSLWEHVMENMIEKLVIKPAELGRFFILLNYNPFLRIYGIYALC